MSLLLLFLSGEHGPQLSGSAAAAVGASARAALAKGMRGSAIVASGASAVATAGRGASSRAAASAGALARSVAVSTAHNGVASSWSGVNARGIGGKNMRGYAAGVGGFTARQRIMPLHVGTPILRLTRLVLFLDTSEIAFTKVGESGPYARLISIGMLRLAARAGRLSGQGVSESTSVTVSLDNTGLRVSTIIGRPLRVRAEIYDGEDLFFVGTVASITYGRTVDLTLEA